MSATIHIKTTVLPGGKIEIDTSCLAVGSEVIVTIESAAEMPDYVYDPATDPLAHYIGAFDSGDLPPLSPREHDIYFAGGKNDATKE